MATLVIILALGILSIVGQYLLVQKFGKNALLSVVKAIAYVAVAVPCCLLVFLNPGLFKDFEGHSLAVMVSVFTPWIVDCILGTMFGGYRYEH